MANNPYPNKIEISGVVKLDLTGDTVTADRLLSGHTAHDKTGKLITGTLIKVGTLLNTTSLGTINTTSTAAASLNISCSVSGINNYELLIVESSVDTITNGRHMSTIVLIFLTASSEVDEKNGSTIATARMNMKAASDGAVTATTSTTAYGIYPNSCSVSNGTATMPMYRRYNNANTGTLNGTYTTRVYGVNLYDLIGG